VGTLTFEMLDRHRTPEQMHASMRQLATSRLSPRKMRVVCNIGHIWQGHHDCAQYLAKPEYKHVWSKVKVLEAAMGRDVQLLQASYMCRPPASNNSSMRGRPL
jgi:hypothetical protein